MIVDTTLMKWGWSHMDEDYQIKHALWRKVNCSPVLPNNEGHHQIKVKKDKRGFSDGTQLKIGGGPIKKLTKKSNIICNK